MPRAVLAMVRNRYPKAVSAFGESNIIALLREPQRGACSWDAARILAATNGESPPRPTPVLLGLLGTPCSSCKTAFRAARVARRETEHVEAVTAAGLSPEAAGRLRTPEQVASYADSARALRSATRPATPTSRKPPDPLYYTPRRRQLPER